MATKGNNMGFVPMSSISKKADPKDIKCSDWVATEKVHGSSFQIYTSDGMTISTGSRTRNLDGQESFIRCNIKELMKTYQEYSLKAWHIIHSQDRWEQYRETSTEFKNDEDDDDSDDSSEEEEEESSNTNGSLENKDICRVRIYGELYGGGGVEKSEKSAVQKEILYCDEFRFYVFGLTINKKWVTTQELNDICREAGFPYYAKPVCKPMATMEDLKKHLEESGFMRSRSAMTEKEGYTKTLIEGVVMTPLKRPDFKLHAVKFLAPAFTDVRVAQFGTTKTANFCTKQRYHSVISKLDIHERNDTKMVVNMFIEDIIKEMENKTVAHQMKEKWAKLVLEWLAEDEYNADEAVIGDIIGVKKSDKIPREYIRNKEEEEMKRATRKSQKEEIENNDDDDLGVGLFDL